MLQAARKLYNHRSRHLAAVLLAASEFADHAWQLEAVTKAERIVGDDMNDYLCIWAHRRRQSLRGLSHELIYQFLTTKPETLNPRLSAHHRLLILSFLSDRISKVERSPKSTLGFALQYSELISMARIAYFQEQFADCLRYLQGIPSLTLNTLDPITRIISYNFALTYAHAYCELGNFKKAERVLKTTFIQLGG